MNKLLVFLALALAACSSSEAASTESTLESSAASTDATLRPAEEIRAEQDAAERAEAGVLDSEISTGETYDLGNGVRLTVHSVESSDLGHQQWPVADLQVRVENHSEFDVYWSVTTRCIDDDTHGTGGVVTESELNPGSPLPPSSFIDGSLLLVGPLEDGMWSTGCTPTRVELLFTEARLNGEWLDARVWFETELL